MISIVIPKIVLPFDEITKQGLMIIISIIRQNDFSETNKNAISTALNNSDILKFHLIALMMPINSRFAVNAVHDVIANLPFCKQQAIFQILIECGAQFDHLIALPNLSIQDLKIYTKYLGAIFLKTRLLTCLICAAYQWVNMILKMF